MAVVVLADLPEWVRHGVYVSDALRRLGFAAEEIYFYVATEGDTREDCFFIAVHEDGPKRPPSFAYAVVPLRITGNTSEEALDAWTRATERWNALSGREQGDFREQNHNRFVNTVTLVEALVRRGHSWRFSALPRAHA